MLPYQSWPLSRHRPLLKKVSEKTSAINALWPVLETQPELEFLQRLSLLAAKSAPNGNYVSIEGGNGEAMAHNQRHDAVTAALSVTHCSAHRFAVNTGDDEIMEMLLRTVPEAIAVLHLDSHTGDQFIDYGVILASLKHFSPKLLTGGVLIIDCFGKNRACRYAVYEWLITEARGNMLHTWGSTFAWWEQMDTRQSKALISPGQCLPVKESRSTDVHGAALRLSTIAPSCICDTSVSAEENLILSSVMWTLASQGLDGALVDVAMSSVYGANAMLRSRTALQMNVENEIWAYSRNIVGFDGVHEVQWNNAASLILLDAPEDIAVLRIDLKSRYIIETLNTFYDAVSIGGIVIIRVSVTQPKVHEEVLNWLDSHTSTVDANLQSFGDILWWWQKNHPDEALLQNTLVGGQCIPTTISSSASCLCPIEPTYLNT